MPPQTLLRHSAGTLAPDLPAFSRYPNGAPLSMPTNPILTLPNCRTLCGCGDATRYTDIGPRLST